MPHDDLDEAVQAERSGDAADADQAAAAYYRQAQRLLLPAGVAWTCREEYDRRMEAFERVQQKIYRLPEKENLPRPTEAAAPEAEVPPVSAADAPQSPSAAAPLSVWSFSPGLAVRVSRDFRDYDGQQVRAGEVLHLLEHCYFPYEAGHTLRFAERTIRLAGIVDEHEPIVANANNAWFQPIP